MRLTKRVVLLGLLALSAPVRAEDRVIDLGRGPVLVHAPPSYDPGLPIPLVLLLHGYGSTGDLQELYMRFRPLSDEFGFLYAHPDGTEDRSGAQFWNATDFCCDFLRTGVDDSGNLWELIDTIQDHASIDPDRIYIVGHSNGGFMAYRMACDHADTIAAVASLAGATWSDPDRCAPSEPVHVLQIHGTEDDTVRVDGSPCLAPAPCHPGAVESARQWAAFDGCQRQVDTSAPPRNFDLLAPGRETRSGVVEVCAPGGSVQVWAMAGSGHVPLLTPGWSRAVIEFFYAHPKGR